MKTLEISTRLDAPPEVVRDHAGRSALLQYVTRGVMKFAPVEPPEFPEYWRPGRYKVRMYWKGFLPIGWQEIVIEPQPMKGDVWSIRDNGRGPLARTWDHVIEVSPAADGTLYVDRISIDAGALTPLVALFADRFYRHRQKRWRRLVRNGFDYSA